MKFFERKFIILFAVSAVMLLSEGLLQGQEANRATASNQAAVQQDQGNQSVESAGTLQQKDQTRANDQQEMKNTEQKKDVKKIQSSSPDLTRKKGARPPSISRPSGSGMPKGAGKPAGVTRPGRR